MQPSARWLAGSIALRRPLTSGWGVVICNPLGLELLYAHRAMRHLAHASAMAGFPTLRFDYEGTGDSAGDSADRAQVAAWTRSIGCAVDTLKAMTGLDRVCLVGLRLGATLAASAAAGRGDIAALVAIAPVVNAQTYLRELRAMALARPQKKLPAWAVVDPDLEDAGGFELSAETRTDLAVINLLRIEAKLADRVLVIGRDDVRLGSAWPDHLRACGSEVDDRKLPGYASMMVDPHNSVVPGQMIRATTEWLTTTCQPELPGSGHAGDDRAPSVRASAHLGPGSNGGRRIHESMESLDPGRVLFGILSEPAERAASQPAPSRVILMLNSGGNHHIGPGRMYVTLARYWAAQGETVLRMDLSGIGDSRPHLGEPENIIYSPHALKDIAAAIDFVRRRFGVVDCVAMGICSGAYHGFRAAVAGLPLRGFVAINPLTFFWKEGMPLDEGAYRLVSEANRLATTNVTWTMWTRLFKGDVDVVSSARILLRRLLAMAKHGLQDVARQVGVELADDLAGELRRVARQNVRMSFVFAGDDPGRQLLQEQGGSMVNRLVRQDALQIDLVEAADHTFTQQWAKRRLVDVLTGLLTRPTTGPVSQ